VASAYTVPLSAVLCECQAPCCPPACLLVCLFDPSVQGAVVTQCYPTYYYAVHETGHRMGFRHANMYRL